MRPREVRQEKVNAAHHKTAVDLDALVHDTPPDEWGLSNANFGNTATTVVSLDRSLGFMEAAPTTPNSYATSQQLNLHANTWSTIPWTSITPGRSSETNLVDLRGVHAGVFYVDRGKRIARGRADCCLVLIIIIILAFGPPS